MIAEMLTRPDGTKLRIGRWEPVTPMVQGTVLLLQGYAEFMEKYEETVAEFLQRGWRVVSFDWRGQGLSSRALPQRQRGHITDYALHLDDLGAVIQHTLPDDGTPILLCAHSKGGHIALRYLLQGHRASRFCGAILSAPMLGINTGIFPLLAAQTIAARAVARGNGARYALTQRDYQPPHNNQFDKNNTLTSDPQRFQRSHQAIAKNPDLALGGVTNAWLDATFRSIAALKQTLAGPAIAGFTLPVCILSAPQDRVVRAQDHQVLAQKLPNARLHVYQQARHELLIETSSIRNRVWHDIDDFIAGITSVKAILEPHQIKKTQPGAGVSANLSRKNS